MRLSSHLLLLTIFLLSMSLNAFATPILPRRSAPTRCSMGSGLIEDAAMFSAPTVVASIQYRPTESLFTYKHSEHDGLHTEHILWSSVRNYSYLQKKQTATVPFPDRVMDFMADFNRIPYFFYRNFFDDGSHKDTFVTQDGVILNTPLPGVKLACFVYYNRVEHTLVYRDQHGQKHFKCPEDVRNYRPDYPPEVESFLLSALGSRTNFRRHYYNNGKFQDLPVDDKGHAYKKKQTYVYDLRSWPDLGEQMILPMQYCRFHGWYGIGDCYLYSNELTVVKYAPSDSFNLDLGRPS